MSELVDVDARVKTRPDLIERDSQIYAEPGLGSKNKCRQAQLIDEVSGSFFY